MKKYYVYYLSVFLILFTAGCHLTIPEEQFLIKKRISYGDSLHLFTTIDEMVGSGFQPEKTYYAYRFGKISQLQGTANGKPLHGQYELFYQKKPVQKGTFRSGLKHGLWYSWNQEGVLIETCTYKKGRKDGDFIKYDNQGNPVFLGSYDDGEIDGKATVINEGKATRFRYKDGIVTDTISSTGFKFPKISKGEK
ncbi:MAG: hypothetical protein WBA74_24070 [Cyclobacteriaceae bacterium]